MFFWEFRHAGMGELANMLRSGFNVRAVRIFKDCDFCPCFLKIVLSCGR